MEILFFQSTQQGEIIEADERVGRRYVQQLEDLRSQLEKEKEMALRKERDMARQRFVVFKFCISFLNIMLISWDSFVLASPPGFFFGFLKLRLPWNSVILKPHPL